MKYYDEDTQQTDKELERVRKKWKRRSLFRKITDIIGTVFLICFGLLLVIGIPTLCYLRYIMLFY